MRPLQARSDAPVHTHHLTFGEGPRRALALHCTLGHAGAWRGVGKALGHAMTLTAPDMPGHGGAADWDGTGDLHDAWTETALAFLETPMDVIGHSFGATVALRLAIAHPEKVRSLTLTEPVFFAAAKSQAPQALAAHMQEAAPYIAALEAGEAAQAARLFNRLWGDGTRWDDFRASARTYMTQRIHFIPAQTPAIFDDSHGLLAPGMMERADMPTLLIEGTQSPAIVHDINAALARRLPQARRETVAQAGHMAPMTHATEVAEAILRLVQVR